MTLFIVLVLTGSFGWLCWEGWQRYRRKATPQIGSDFAAEVAHRALQQELNQLRVVVAAQQQQLAALQEEMAQLKTARETAHSVSKLDAPSAAPEGQPSAALPHAKATAAAVTDSTTAISPEYAEPLALARRGLDPEALVARCGVTLAEAQLIWALARSTIPQEGQEHAEAI